MSEIFRYTILATFLIPASAQSQNRSAIGFGSLAVVYADHDSIVIGADTKRTLRLRDSSGKDPDFITSVIACKISQIDSNVYFASTGTGFDSLTGFSLVQLVTSLYSNTKTLETVVLTYIDRVKKALSEIVLASKDFDPIPANKELVESVWCGFIDKKPAIFLHRFTYTPTELKPDSVTVHYNYWFSAKSKLPYVWWPLGSHSVSHLLRNETPDYLIKTGPVCGIKAMIMHGAITDSADIGLPLDLAIIKPDTTIWVERGACNDPN